MPDIKKLFANKRCIKPILTAFIYVAVFAGIGFLINNVKSGWYLSLTKPILLPPGYVFIIAWSVIYLLFILSISLFICTDTNNKLKTKQAVLYALQGLFYLLWLLMVFQFHWLSIGLVVLLLYISITYVSITNSLKINKLSAYLQIPFLIWLIYATVLNYLLVLLN